MIFGTMTSLLIANLVHLAWGSGCNGQEECPGMSRGPSLFQVGRQTSEFKVQNELDGKNTKSVQIMKLKATVPEESRSPSVAIGVLTCSCGRNHDQNLLAKILLPSLLLTTTEQDRHCLSIYVGIDSDDPLLQDDVWRSSITEFPFNFTFVPVLKPRPHVLCWNQLLYRPYADGMEYIIRTQDDVQFLTNGWMNKGVDALRQLHPPNIGVVGPTFSEGNTNIFAALDMVHRTHLNIFANPTHNYYPPVFDNWYIDDWITYVYEDGHSKQLKDWTVKHSMSLGQRYAEAFEQKSLVDAAVQAGKEQIRQFISDHSEKLQHS